MDWIDSVEGMQTRIQRTKQEGGRLALVPTSGVLSAGYGTVIEKAKAVADEVVVSILVDPLEFGPNEDYRQFPREPDEDRRLCEALGVDAVFAPSAEAIHPPTASIFVQETRLAEGLCGVSRPHHFRGVATTFVKLIHLLTPSVVVYSEHEMQRIAVIRQLIDNLFLPVEIETVPAVREADGLAADARNAYLDSTQRRDAVQIYAALLAGKRIYSGGNPSVDRIEAETINVMRDTRRLHVLYALVVDRFTMKEMREIIPGRSILKTGVLVDQIRLIDHIEF